MKKLKMEQIKEYIENESPSSKIYIGCDSVSYRRRDGWYADYYLVVVVHKNGRNGCKIFGEVITEKDYNQNKKKPTYRLMNEVYKVAELYLKLSEVIGDREVEVHLDLNPNENYVSSMIISQAIGYIRGVCNVIPMVKPDSWAATHAADRLTRIGLNAL